MAGLQAERQENGFIDIINSSVAKNGGPITLVAGQIRLTNIIRAEKFSGRQASGSEPYTDVKLFLSNKKIPINISMKGPTAPSLAGDGLKGIETIIPGLAKKFMKAVLLYLKRKIKDGDKVPDVYGKISDTDKVKIVSSDIKKNNILLQLRCKLEGNRISTTGKKVGLTIRNYVEKGHLTTALLSEKL